ARHTTKGAEIRHSRLGPFPNKREKLAGFGGSVTIRFLEQESGKLRFGFISRRTVLQHLSCAMEKAALRGGLPSHNGDALSWGWSSCRLPASLGHLPVPAGACRRPAREHSADDFCFLIGPVAAAGPGSGVLCSSGS